MLEDIDNEEGINNHHKVVPPFILVEIDMDLIDVDPNQPRKTFNENKIKELALSIDSRGLLNPILVKPIENGRYQIVTGENRYKAMKLLQKKTITCKIIDVDDKTQFLMQLDENLQRSDLNPIDEALAYQKLIENYQYTHDRIADEFARSRPYITNKLRLLKLPQEIQQDLINGKITESQARTIAGVPEEEQIATFQKIINSKFTSRETEQLVRELKTVSHETSNSIAEETSIKSLTGELIDVESLNLFSVLFDENHNLKKEVLFQDLISAILQDLQLLGGG